MLAETRFRGVVRLQATFRQNVIDGHTGAAEVAEICEQLRAAVAGADWSCLGPGSTVTLCAGAAEMKPGLTRGALVNVADRKLYQAKHTGRNRVMR